MRASRPNATTAATEGADVIVLEKAPVLGGTTPRWIPNGESARVRTNAKTDVDMRSRRFFAQCAERTRRGCRAMISVDYIRQHGIFQLKEWRMWALDEPAVDYLSHVPENKTPTGRPLAATDAEGYARANGGLLAGPQRTDPN